MKGKFRLAAGAICALLVLYFAPKVSGQAAYGTIIGTVTDPSGAEVPDAKVTIVNVDKGFSQTTTANSSGFYSVTNLIPGNYKVTVEGKGFKTFVQNNLPVIVGTSTTLNVTLEIGAVGETITVNAAPPLMETDRASVETDLSSRQVESLPILDRNFTQLELLLPGAAKMPWQHAEGENPQDGVQINNNGQLFSGTNFMIDGMDNTDPVLGIIMVNPPVDSVEEVTATGSNFDPEFSQAGGSVIQVETKSGTNAFHGSAFEFNRINNFEARDPFTQQPIPVPTTGISPGCSLYSSTKNTELCFPSTHWNQFGGSLGGPIRKDKLFVFGYYQGTRRRIGSSVLTRVPTAGEAAGDLSGLGVAIYDPATGNPDGTGRTQFVSFPSGANANSLCTNPAGCLNMIPTSRISPQAANLLKLLPGPTLTNVTGGANNFTGSGVQTYDTNEPGVRVDYVQNSNLRYFGHYAYGGYHLNTPGAFQTAGGPGFTGFNGEGITNARNQNGVGGLNYTLSPTMLADFRFGVTKYRVFLSSPDATQQLATQAGLAGLNFANRPDTWGLPDVNVNSTGGFQMGYQCNCPLNEQDLEYQGVTNWTKVMGNHRFKVGADIRRRRNKRLPSDQHRAGVYAFDPGVTALCCDAQGNPIGGLGEASFLLGDPSQFNRFSQISTTQQDVQWSMYYYGEDTWRLTSKLTLNYGLRWDTWFADESLNAGQGGRYDVSTNTVYIPGVVSQSGGVQTPYHNFSPRLGIAYALNPKTVVRTGWGRSYFEGTFGWTFNTLAADVYPSIVNQSIPAPNAFAPINFGPMPTGCTSPLCVGPPAPVFPTTPSNGRLSLPDGIGTSNIPTNLQIPYVDSYNLSVERAVFKDATLSLGYVGNVGRDLNGGWNLNAPVPGPGSFTSRQPLFTLTPGVPWSKAFGLTQDLFNKCDCESSSYNALQAKFVKRFSANYSLLTSYTWSKTLDYGEFGTESNQYNYRVDHGPAVFDRASIFTLGHTVLLPFGHGQRWGSNAVGWLNVLLGGWQWTGVTTAESGLPFSVTENNTSLNTFDMTLRPDRAGNPFSGSCSNGLTARSANCWFNPGAFSTPAPFTFGNTSRNSLRGPGLFDADWGLHKNFKLTEKFSLLFSWDVFNAFNHPNLQNPDNNISDARAGVISDIVPLSNTSLGMRTQQLGLHFTW